MTPPSRPTAIRDDGMEGYLWRGAARLVLCLPAAGGSALSFRPLAEALAGQATVIAVNPQRPARADVAGSVEELAARVARIAARWWADDVVLLGHSFGGYVAYESARLLRRRYPDPRTGPRLVVVGCAPPSHASDLLDPDAAEDELVEGLTRLDAVPPAVLAIPGLLRRYLPAIRSDLRSVRDYVRRARDGRPLSVATLALAGRADRLVPPHVLVHWARHCEPATTRVVAGDHYLPQREPRLVATTMREWSVATMPAPVRA